MEVGSALGRASSDTGASAWARSSPSLDYDAFLQLLIAQMKNQDPTQPMESAEYIAQLATFSNVEQAVKANAKLDSLMTQLSLLQADAIIGRMVTSEDGTVTGEVVALRIVNGGAIAVLASGRELPLGPGVTVK